MERGNDDWRNASLVTDIKSKKVGIRRHEGAGKMREGKWDIFWCLYLHDLSPQLVILDDYMPEAGVGREISKKLNVPSMIFSGEKEPIEREKNWIRWYKKGVNEILTFFSNKPINGSGPTITCFHSWFENLVKTMDNLETAIPKDE